VTQPLNISFEDPEIDAIAEFDGAIVAFLGEDGTMDALAKRVNRLMKGALVRLSESGGFAKGEAGHVTSLAFPVGLAAKLVLVVKLSRRASVQEARLAGAAIAKALNGKKALVLAGVHNKAAEIAYGLALRCYDFDIYRTTKEAKTPGAVRFMVSKAEEVSQKAAVHAALVEGVFFTRDLTNEPANVLTTFDFAAPLAAMEELGLEVEIIEEDQLEKLGMKAFLGVGLGSETPTKMVVMRWNGGGAEAPFALVGKGVVFDTGGISLKPGAGMEDMTMDMGGAGVVAGVMRALALRKARANVVGLVGLVENMPDGRAQRPGDVVTSMKGDTIEVINTDAEGRLVLADVLWYAQETFAPVGMIDLATLTGAAIIALGHENAAVFSNDDLLADHFLKAAAAEGEGAWRMPLGKGYDKQIKSRIADMKNVGGRPAGSITAAQFLQRFVKPDTPWIHLDIAGVASQAAETDFAPKGATGWGVRALDRLIRDHYEAE